VTAESFLVLIFGMVCGGFLGYVSAWRLARKLEHHGVALWKWDEPIDLAAPRTKAKPIDLGSRR